jgi:plasmid replication initiation protein
MYAIEPAIKEINEKSDIFTSFVVVKNGRAISEINFMVKSQKTREEVQKLEDIDIQLQQF